MPDASELPQSRSRPPSHLHSLAVLLPQPGAPPVSSSSSLEPPKQYSQQACALTTLPIASLPPNVTIRAPTKANIHLLKRINSLLLPVSYPENFYREILQNPESEILTRLAFYDDECVGGIRCRVETEAEYKAVPEKLGAKGNGGSNILNAIAREGDHSRLDPAGVVSRISKGAADQPTKTKIYIMTLAVLSPYRSLSIGSHLLDYIISIAAKDPSIDADEAYAHVWVANDGALDFYRKQGFDVNSGTVVQDYYRRLEPRDARIVFRKIPT
ncbi:hypothetical protein H072_5612 [Dactylellina haptotyla CBS 200.50]|uniref:N-acetyltransferase domain-containing protein n=1 Tax=Dactylellina haptotyla (strain CBS 200.50) TaxID=1284197 RepID=S8AC74_DACHA|nr:hypothetical protein H072_5612 [Dactylellina haptotyla CBS 200.50]